MLAFASALLAYSSLNPATPRVPTPAATTTPLFSGSGLVSHATYSAGDDDTCSKPVEVPTRLEVAAEPRAMPKKAAEGEAQEIDPLGLWTPPKPNKPKGPNVYTLNLGAHSLHPPTPSFLLFKNAHASRPPLRPRDRHAPQRLPEGLHREARLFHLPQGH